MLIFFSFCLRDRERSALGGSCEHRFVFSAAYSAHSCFWGGGNAEVFGNDSDEKVREDMSLFFIINPVKPEAPKIYPESIKRVRGLKEK